MLVQNHNLQDDIAYQLIEQTTLQEKVKELAIQINDFYQDQEDLLLICVLKGAYIFLGDLSRYIQRPHEVDFMAISSYAGNVSSSGAVRIIMDLKQDIAGRHVLVVEDIIDSGYTLAYLQHLLLARNPASLRIVALLNKPERREVAVKVDYIGFDIPNEFVVGYGLDFDGLYRNLPYIAVLKPEVFAHILNE